MPAYNSVNKRNKSFWNEFYWRPLLIVTETNLETIGWRPKVQKSKISKSYFEIFEKFYLAPPKHGLPLTIPLFDNKNLIISFYTILLLINDKSLTLVHAGREAQISSPFLKRIAECIQNTICIILRLFDIPRYVLASLYVLDFFGSHLNLLFR